MFRINLTIAEAILNYFQFSIDILDWHNHPNSFEDVNLYQIFNAIFNSLEKKLIEVLALVYFEVANDTNIARLDF